VTTDPLIAQKRLELAADARKLEIGLLWQRALFFWPLIGAAFVGVAASLEEHRRLALLLSCFGLVCSVCWSLANRGSKYWQEAWEQKVRREEDAIDGPLYSRIEPVLDKGPWLSARRYSVSKLMILLGDYVCLVWLTIVSFLTVTVIDWHGFSRVWRDSFTLVFLLGTVAFVFLALRKGRAKHWYDAF
jgi:hypothetical protein